MKRTMIATMIALMFGSAAFAGQLTDAQRAEQRRQQQAAQRAYTASSQSHEEAGRGYQQAQDAAKTVRNVAVSIATNAVVAAAK